MYIPSTVYRNNTKNFLFSGGRYIESHDKGWVDVYNKLSTNFSPALSLSGTTMICFCNLFKSKAC